MTIYKYKDLINYLWKQNEKHKLSTADIALFFLLIQIQQQQNKYIFSCENKYILNQLNNINYKILWKSRKKLNKLNILEYRSSIGRGNKLTTYNFNKIFKNTKQNNNDEYFTCMQHNCTQIKTVSNKKHTTFDNKLNYYIQMLSQEDKKYTNIIIQWLKYKNERKQMFKYPSTNGFNAFLKRLKEFSNGDIKLAENIITRAIEGNWYTIYPYNVNKTNISIKSKNNDKYDPANIDYNE